LRHKKKGYNDVKINENASIPSIFLEFFCSSVRFYYLSAGLKRCEVPLAGTGKLPNAAAPVNPGTSSTPDTL
jgi:hypothetical protein